MFLIWDRVKGKSPKQEVVVKWPDFLQIPQHSPHLGPFWGDIRGDGQIGLIVGVRLKILYLPHFRLFCTIVGCMMATRAGRLILAAEALSGQALS